MIIAAGLTPAWQHILSFDRLERGEVNRARESHWCASGKVVNVGLALHSLGANSLTVAPLGGLSGEAIAREFAEGDLPARWTRCRAGTRVCTTILEAETGPTTELVENARTLSREEIDEFRVAFREEARAADLVVISGSLPPGIPASIYRDLLVDFRGRALIDARGPELLAALSLQPFLVKPNREELARTLGREIPDERGLRAAMEETRSLGAQWVVVSRGSGSLWALGPEGLFSFEPPEVPVVNPIGCGDCLAAGIAWALDDGRDVVEAIRLGMGAAGQNATAILPSRLDLPTVRSIAARVGSTSAAVGDLTLGG